MGKFFSTLIIIGGLVGAFFVLKDHFTETRAAQNPWISKMREIVASQSRPAQDIANVEDPWYADEGQLFRLMAMMYEVERGKYNLVDAINGASSGAPGAGQAKMVADALKENYDLAKKLGVFNDPGNVLTMERGDAPLAKAKGWEDEKLAVIHRVSPLLAPEASRSLINMMLIPEALRDAQTALVTNFTTDTIKKWVTEKVITPESAEAIAQIVMAKGR